MDTKDQAAVSKNETDQLNGDANKEIWPIGKKAAFFTLALSCAFCILDFCDRQVLASLFPYLKKDMGFSDSQLGLLVSIVNMSIAVFTVPAGYLIDRWSRKYMLGIMTFFWSLATGACAFVGTYTHLLICRFFIGTGEAGYVPAAQSLISASFPKKMRATALSIFITSISFGGPLGIVTGAFIAQHWGWRHAFGVVAIPGLIAAFLCIFLKDFKVKKVEEHAKTAAQETVVKTEPWVKVILSVLKTPSCLITFFALAGHNMFASVLVNWSISYFHREAGMDPTTASLLSTTIWIGLAAGHIITGAIIDYLRKKKGCPTAITFVIICTLACFFMEFAAFSYVRPGSALQATLFAAGMCCTGSILPIGYTVTADLNPPHHRGTAMGVLTFVQNALGMAIGPVLAGFLSDTFGLANSLIALSFLELFVALCWVAVRALYNWDLAKVVHTEISF